MAKNLTISIPDYLWNAMKEYSEVNWSQIGRNAISNYINQRLEAAKHTLLMDLSKHLTNEGVSQDLNANLLQELRSKMNFHINYHEEQYLSNLNEFKPENWKDELYGQLEKVTDFLMGQNYSIGTRELLQDEINLYITKGNKHLARELRGEKWNFGLFAYNDTTFVFIYGRSQEPYLPNQ